MGHTTNETDGNETTRSSKKESEEKIVSPLSISLSNTYRVFKGPILTHDRQLGSSFRL
jgi:hypothetical protein